MKRTIMCLTAALLFMAIIGQIAGAQAQAAIIGPDEATKGEEILFRANMGASALPNYTYQWVFDGGNTSYGPSVSYAFESLGTHNVTLRVLDPSGNLLFTANKDVEIKPDQSGRFLAIVGAGLAVGISGMGAGIGVGIAGSAGAGALADKPKKFSRFLVFQALPQTQAIYGLLVAIFIFLESGLIEGSNAEIPLAAGFLYIGAGLAVGIAGLSAIGQGISASAGIGAYAEKDDMFTRGIIFSVLPETQAIYGFLVSILLIFMGGAKVTESSIASMGMGFAAVGAGLAVGIAGLSAIGQGISAGAGIGAYSRSKDTFTRSLIFAVMSETFAIFGLLIAILAMMYTGFF